MEVEDVEEVEHLIERLDDLFNETRENVKEIAEVFDQIVSLCDDQPSFLSAIKKEKRALDRLRNLVIEFPLIRQLKRRLPRLKSSVVRNENRESEEKRRINRETEKVQSDLQDILRKFLR